jgi:hypothetical protein
MATTPHTASDAPWPVQERAQRILEAMERAARRAGRNPSEVTLVAVAKTQPVEAVRAAYDAGLRDIGENYAQELRDKAASLSGLPELCWHAIGALQRNKAKYVAEVASVYHAACRLDVLRELDRRCHGRPPLDCLVEVNLAGESSKAGVAPAELPELLDGFGELSQLRCVGLMTLPPALHEGQDPAPTRALFRQLRQLRDVEARRARPGVDLRELSMGMSQDFEVAIEEGATLVRIGTALFGRREP